MKIRVEKQVLQEALQLVQAITSKATSEQYISSVLIQTKQGGISLKATNYEITFEGGFPAEVLEEGQICLSSSKLFNLVRNFQGLEVHFESTPQNWVFLTCGNSKVRLPGLDPQSYPPIEFKELANAFTLPGSLLKAAIDRTFFAIGENESRKNLMGLNLETLGENQLRWMGADAFRISQLVTQSDQPVAAQGNIIIPKKSLPEIKRIIDHNSGELQLSFDDNQFQLFTSQIKFKTRLIEADYPNLESLLSQQAPIQLSLPKDELIHAVRILNTLTDDDHNAVMKLTLGPGEVLVESQKLEYGEANDRIACDYQGEAMSVGLNIQFFMEGLMAFDTSGDKMVTLHITGPVAPMMLTSASWEQFKTILMPVKIKW
ncbi:MAG: DNA polymerase III subunit beta [bacterium]|nr:DNA polymerase III subunit beta [bacterium]